MRALIRLSAVLCMAAFATHAAPSAELLDLASRIHYGFYNAEPRAIDAAAAGLERLPDSAEVVYYRDLAALRRAQLGSSDRGAVADLEECAERETSKELDKRFAAEVFALAAACAELGGDDSRRQRALSEARARDGDNPRIALVEAWAHERGASADAASLDAAAAKLAAAVEAFEAWTPSVDEPEWGHAEALTALAASALRRGQARAARDLLERALLLAPDYGTALELRAALQSARPADRAP